jgi:hypothetical protein
VFRGRSRAGVSVAQATMPSDSSSDIGAHARAVGFSYYNAPHGSGVWVGFVHVWASFMAWQGVFFLAVSVLLMVLRNMGDRMMISRNGMADKDKIFPTTLRDFHELSSVAGALKPRFSRYATFRVQAPTTGKWLYILHATMFAYHPHPSYTLPSSHVYPPVN